MSRRMQDKTHFQSLEVTEFYTQDAQMLDEAQPSCSFVLRLSYQPISARYYDVLLSSLAQAECSLRIYVGRKVLFYAFNP